MEQEAWRLPGECECVAFALSQIKLIRNPKQNTHIRMHCTLNLVLCPISFSQDLDMSLHVSGFAEFSLKLEFCEIKSCAP